MRKTSVWATDAGQMDTSIMKVQGDGVDKPINDESYSWANGEYRKSLDVSTNPCFLPLDTPLDRIAENSLLIILLISNKLLKTVKHNEETWSSKLRYNST
jgi:hypothetical protein